jgi:transcriptional enhancer factor
MPGLNNANISTVLIYLVSLDKAKKNPRGKESSYAYHPSHVRGRHRAIPTSNYDHNSTSTHPWQAQESLPLSLNMRAGLLHDNLTSPYVVKDFAMFVEDGPVHYFTQLSSDGRLGDSTWQHQQFPEFNILGSKPVEWAREDGKVLLCDAKMKIMIESRPKASLIITFDLKTQYQLAVFESIQCTTRFYDSGDNTHDPQFDGPNADDLKEHRTPCDYVQNAHGAAGRLRITFGSKFWVNRMRKYQSLRHRDDGTVNNSLLRVTATQDIYGFEPGTGEAVCLLTILWRFTQTTKSSAEVGSMKQRTITFGNTHAPAMKPDWIKDEEHMETTFNDMHGEHDSIMDCATSGAREMLYHPDSQISLEYQHPHPSHHAYDVQPIHDNHTPQPHLHILVSIHPGLEHPGLEYPHAPTAPSASTDYSKQSLPNLSHSQDTIATYSHDNNDFDFNSGHITISGAFKPSISLSAYDSFVSQSAGLDGLHALTGLDQDVYSLGLDDNELVGVDHYGMQDAADMNSYSTKPNWHHANLIFSLENAAEKYHDYMTHESHQLTHVHDMLPAGHSYGDPSPALTQGEEELVAQGLHDAYVHVSTGLWSLQSPFHEDVGSGADGGGGLGIDYRKDSIGQGLGDGEHPVRLGLGVLDLIERDQRSRGY